MCEGRWKDPHKNCFWENEKCQRKKNMVLGNMPRDIEGARKMNVFIK